KRKTMQSQKKRFPFPPKSEKYPIEISERAFLYLEVDLIYFIELTTLLQKETGWDARKILNWIISDEFPEAYFSINSQALPDFAWAREDIEKYLAAWRKKRKHS